MREHLVEHRPPLTRADDQWMLDRWTTPEQHIMTTVYRDRRVPNGRGGWTVDRDYREVCTCGYRSIEFVAPVHHACCPVLEALQDRARRLKRINERIDWLPYVSPVIEVDPRD